MDTDTESSDIENEHSYIVHERYFIKFLEDSNINAKDDLKNLSNVNRQIYFTEIGSNFSDIHF